MKAFTTSGAGFIGSHLATRLIELGDRVVVLEDLSTGSMDNIAHRTGRHGFAYRIGSALDVPLVAYTEGFEDVPRRVPELSRLENTIGFRPRTSLAQIVGDVIADQRDRLVAR